MTTAIVEDAGFIEAADPYDSEAVRVLVVDDDPAYQHLCKRYLAKNPKTQYDVVEAGSATEAYTLCKETEFDCVLVDYVLPDELGTQLVETLGSSEHGYVPPMIIMTAGSGEAAATEAVRAGATDFFSKRVVSAESLSRAINNAVEKGRLKRSVEERGRDLQALNRQLQAKNDEIQRFYQSVSHEVKTPLAAAREFVALVFDGIAGAVSDEQKEILHYALDSCDQISSHFNDLIEMTRLDAAKVTMDKSLGDLESVVARCLASIASAMKAKQLHLHTEIETSLPLLYIDANRVIQVLSNLLGNAIKFTDAGGQITLTISHRARERAVQISVADTGRGIPEKDLPYVFGRLYQVDNTGDEFMGAGLGLGLTIAKEIVALHGGEIWVESNWGSGSVFSFSLPVAQSVLSDAEIQSEIRSVNS